MPRRTSSWRPRIAAALVGIALLALGSAAAQSTATQPTVATFLEDEPRFATFTAIVERAGRMQLLRDRDLVTVFAPTEEAFGALDEATVRTLRQDADLARAFVDLHLIVHDLIHEATGQLVANGAVNPVERVVALPTALRERSSGDQETRAALAVPAVLRADRACDSAPRREDTRKRAGPDFGTGAARHARHAGLTGTG